MLLHEHPLNLQREARGLRPLNALWLSGGAATAATPRDAGVHLLGAHPLAAVLPLANDATSPGTLGSRQTEASRQTERPRASAMRDAEILVWLHRPSENRAEERPPQELSLGKRLPEQVAALLSQGAFSLRILEPSGQQCYERRRWHGLRVWRKPLRSLAQDRP